MKPPWAPAKTSKSDQLHSQIQRWDRDLRIRTKALWISSMHTESSRFLGDSRWFFWFFGFVSVWESSKFMYPFGPSSRRSLQFLTPRLGLWELGIDNWGVEFETKNRHSSLHHHVSAQSSHVVTNYAYCTSETRTSNAKIRICRRFSNIVKKRCKVKACVRSYEGWIPAFWFLILNHLDSKSSSNPASQTGEKSLK